MEAVEQRVLASVQGSQAGVGNGVRGAGTRLLEGLKKRGAAAVQAFQDSRASDLHRQELLEKIKQDIPARADFGNHSAFLFSRERNESIPLNDGINHLRWSESGEWVALSREEVGRSGAMHFWELKIDGDRIEVRSSKNPKSIIVESNDILDLESSFLVKIVPLHLRRRTP